VAPFDGILGIRKVNRGEYVNAGTGIVSLQSLDPIFLNFTLPQQRLGDVSEGQPIIARVDAFPKRVFKGVVTAIEPQVERTTRNFMVQASVQNPDHKLRPGMFARVELEYGKRQDVLTVPQTAISFNPYGDSVYVIHTAQRAEREAVGQTPKPDAQAHGPADESSPITAKGSPSLTATQRFVRTGSRRGDLIAIVEGLKAGDRIATSGLLKLRNDAVVIINNKVRPEADVAPMPPNS
jgi:membrane fusion protein (multidrug efflux system)